MRCSGLHTWSDIESSGDEVRRLGEEGLFEELRDTTLEALGAREFQSVFTTDLHAFNALTHSYGLEQPVRHHSQVMAELMRNGKLDLQAPDDDRVYTYHDPCYLGRHNDIYDEPRQALKKIPGLELTEMADSLEDSLCCGGGGGRIWMETLKGERFSDLRIEQAVGVGAEVLVTACPYCITHFEESRLTLEDSETTEIKDITEILEEVI